MAAIPVGGFTGPVSEKHAVRRPPGYRLLLVVDRHVVNLIASSVDAFVTDRHVLPVR